MSSSQVQCVLQNAEHLMTVGDLYENMQHQAVTHGLQ